MKPNIDGLYNEQEHEYWEAWRVMRDLYPFVFKDMEYNDFIKWLNSSVENLKLGEKNVRTQDTE